FTASGASSFDCSVDVALVNCGNSRTLSVGGLTEGSHTARVKAYDPAGNSGPTLVYNFVVDVDLTTTFTQRPADTMPVGVGAHAFTAAGANSFDCAYDSATLFNCGNDRAQAIGGLADGPHTFTVQAIDSAGNRGARITDSFTVDSGSVLNVFVRPT